MSDLGDFDMVADEHQVAEKGKVLLYTSKDRTSEPMSMTVDTSLSLPKVLKNLSQLYSPIRSKYFYSL